MKKLLTIITSLLLIPTLALAAGGAGKKISDEEYRKILINNPISESFNEDGISGTINAVFHANGTFEQHVSFKSFQGSGDIDMYANWSVKKAILHMHMTKMTHSDTHNQQLNHDLDGVITEVMKNPDIDIPLENTKSVRSLRPLMLGLDIPSHILKARFCKPSAT